MTTPLSRLLITAAAVCVTTPPVSAQGNLSGRVVDAATGRPLPAAEVTLVPTGHATLTGPDGTFAFDHIPRIARALRVVRVGYATLERELSREFADPVELALAEKTTELAGIRVVGEGGGAAALRFAGAVNLVTASELRATRPLSGNEALKLVPGVHVQEEEGMGFRANIGIRGLDPDRSRTLLVLEDGVPVALAPYGEPEMYYTPPIDRMERVELVKGSGSILFGPQTVGGVLNYVTADPPVQPSGRMELIGGSGSFGMGKLSYGGTWDGTGFIIGALRRQASDLRGLRFEQTDVTGKFSLELGPADAVGVKLGVYDESSNSTYVGLTDSLFRADPTLYPGQDDELRIRRYSASLAHERNFRPGRALRTVAYAYQTSRNWSRQDYSYSPSGNAIEFRNSTGNRDRSFEVAGLEPRLRLEHDWGEFEGGVRAHYELANDRHVNGSTATARTGVVRDDETRTGYALAAFGQQRFDLTDRWRVTPGLRFEYFSYSRHIVRTRVRREVVDGEGNVTGTTRVIEDVDLRSRDDLVAVIPGIGVSWLASGGVTLFAGAHRGFSPPRIKDALVYSDPVMPPDQQPGDPVSLELDAEKSWNLELGGRTRPLPGVSLDAALFYLDFSNQIVEPSLSAGTVSEARLANQGATRHRGFEAALGVDWGMLARSGASFRTDLRYTYADAEFSRDRFVRNAAGDTVNVEGNRLPYAPRHTVALGATLTLPDELTIKVDGSRVGEQYADNFETREGMPNGRNGVIPAYTVVNASGTYRIPHTRFTAIASVKNLLDSTYMASRRPEGIKPGVPRLVQVGVEWEF